MTRITLLAALILAPLPALAVGSDDPAPRPKTETTTQCADGQVFDPNKGVCVTAEQSGFNDDALFDAARELAENGHYESAILVASAMANPESDKALTILGFATRKAGRREEGMALYAKAITQNPDNLLVRSYKGMAHVEAGEMDLARAELVEIEARGGQGGWPAEALAHAIQQGAGFVW
jgi:tetratricopeptide (TPR) repeat protein